MDRECKCSIPSKVNRKCAYEGKCRSRFIIYEVTCSICDDVYIGNTQQKFKKIMDGHFSDLLRLLKNGKNQIHLPPIINSSLMLLQIHIPTQVHDIQHSK